ncbi:hypothetical protein V5O48_017537 [Marasmius crinis-equi]|uniref:Bacteriophage T5 Orf172 DNA-binding domain-containing protein n=1 Tax=Marasmius crinis-equi TaxID=585013 RepID=A0ABR3ENP7_9AGAR
MSTLPAFALGCFALPNRTPHQSLCAASSFDDKHLQRWIKHHELLERTFLNQHKQEFVYVFKIDGVSFDSIVDFDLTGTSAYKLHTWFDPIPVRNYVEVERLVHAELERTCVARPRKACGNFGKVHQEIFIVIEEPDVVEKLKDMIETQNVKAS